MLTSSPPQIPRTPEAPLETGGLVYYISPRDSSPTPGICYTHPHNHARLLRLEKLLYLELPRNSNGFFKPLLDPGGGLTTETAARRSELKRPLRNRF
jgi:hypothetical protein